MTLDELKAKLPSELQPWAGTYGPVVLAWTAADIQAWLQKIALGDIYSAYEKVLQGLDDQQSVDEWAKLDTKWKSANADNAARHNLAEEAIVAVCKIVLAFLLTLVGL